MKKLGAILAMGVLATALMAGCGGSADKGATGNNNAKHLNLGVHAYARAEEDVFDPAKTSWMAMRLGIGETLFKINDELKLEPNLAESFKLIDNKTWEFKIKDGIKFSNGKPLTAEAVKACLDRTISKNGRARSMLKIDSIAANGQTLTIKTKTVNAALANNLADVVGVIVDVSDADKEGVFMAGTGPFAVKSKSKGVLELVANENYWKGKPNLKSVTVKYMADGNAHAMALDKGEVDLSFMLPQENLAQFEKNDKFNMSSRSGSRSLLVYFDTTNELLADKTLRKAITMAVDRKTLAEVVNKNRVAPATAIFPTSMEFGKVEGIPYDVAAAKKLLKDAGYTDTNGDGILEKNGKPLQFKWYTYQSTGGLLTKSTEAIQPALKDIGVAIDIQVNGYDAHTKILKNGGFDMALNGYIMTPVADPQYFADLLLKTGADYNYGKYSNPQVDALVDQLDAEFDTAKRIDLAKKMQALEVEDCGFLTLGHQNFYVIGSKKVSGYETQPTELYLLTKDTDIK